MQTFVFYVGKDGILKTAKILDDRRLNCQIQEAKMTLIQVYFLKNGTLPEGKKVFNKHHPCGFQWLEYEDALKYYTNVMIDEWIRRGKNFNGQKEVIEDEENIVFPPFLFNEMFITRHRQNIILKDPNHYTWENLEPAAGHFWYRKVDGKDTYKLIEPKKKAEKRKRKEQETEPKRRLKSK